MKNDGVKVSWDDDIPNKYIALRRKRLVMFQPTHLVVGSLRERKDIDLHS